MSEIEIDQLIDSTRVDGSGAEIAPPSLAPLSAWSAVDPDYEEFDTDDSDPDGDEDTDERTQEELDAPEPEGDADTVIEPVGIELWGQNIDEGTEWVKVAEQDLDGDGEAGIAMIPAVPTATQMRYRLRLVYSDGSFSKYSDPQEVTTPRDTTPPPVPSTPLVLTQYGHTRAGWDGELTADSPIDFDHTRLYVQQMEPEIGEEPPEGGYVAGDPQLVTSFSSAGNHMVGFLPEAEHRAFLTSVDTSNNESARSEYVHFSPTPPVDREAIEEEVDKVEGRMDELRESLEQGLSDEVTRLEGEIETAGGTTILRRTEEPTPEDGEDAAEGTIWYQYTALDNGGELDGMWTWDGTDWVESTISEKIMAKVHIEEGTAGSLDVERINGLAAQFRRLHVGGSDNLFPIEALQDLSEHGGDSPDWLLDYNGTDAWTVITDQGGMDLVLRRNDGVHDGISSRLHYRPNGEGIHTQEGEQFRLTFYGWRAVSGEIDGARNWVRAYYRDRHGDYVAFGGRTFFESGWNNYTHTFTVPEGAERVDILFQSESGAPRGHWGDFDLRRMNDGELTVDGSIGARKIDVEDFAADEARMEVMWAGMGNFLEASIDQLFINEGEFRRLRGAKIEGAEFVGGEMKTSDNWASSGGAIVRQDGTYGNVVTANEDGDVTARLGGERNELRGVDVDGVVTARSLRLAGTAYVGSGAEGEGALVPDGGRLRIQGRLPLADAGARDTFTYDFSPVFTINNPTATHYEEWDVVYEEPAPNNTRGVFLQAMQYTTVAGVVSATTPGVSAAGFTARITVQSNAGSSHRIQLRYFSVWR